ncbi:hypothetical protein S83_062359 [Arachis hypogaea]
MLNQNSVYKNLIFSCFLVIQTLKDLTFLHLLHGIKSSHFEMKSMLHFQEGSFSQKTNASLVSLEIPSTTVGGATQTGEQTDRSSPIVASGSGATQWVERRPDLLMK